MSSETMLYPAQAKAYPDKGGVAYSIKRFSESLYINRFAEPLCNRSVKFQLWGIQAGNINK